MITIDIVTLFEFLAEKDCFGDIYRLQLSKRLLNSKSFSDDLEKSMISKLKHKNGAQFTSNMEGMLTDLAMDDGQSNEFEDYLHVLVDEQTHRAAPVGRTVGGAQFVDESAPVLAEEAEDERSQRTVVNTPMENVPDEQPVVHVDLHPRRFGRASDVVSKSLILDVV